MTGLTREQILQALDGMERLEPGYAGHEDDRAPSFGVIARAKVVAEAFCERGLHERAYLHAGPIAGEDAVGVYCHGPEWGRPGAIEVYGSGEVVAACWPNGVLEVWEVSWPGDLGPALDRIEAALPTSSPE